MDDVSRGAGVRTGGGSVVHDPSRRSVARTTGVLIVALALVAAAGCAQSANATWRAPGSAVGSSGAPDAGKLAQRVAGEITITPAADTTGVPVLDHATVTVKDATLDTVTVTNPAGKQVDGEFAADHKSWHTTESFGYAKVYSVAAKATNITGQPIERTAKFTTYKPANQTMPYLRANGIHLLRERSTYGVGQPVVIWFDEKITDKAAVQRLLEVTTSPHVEGAWSWVSSQEVHYRPKEYWRPGTSVQVSANLYGRDLGGGLYGQSDVRADFTIGQSKIAIADANTKHMQVFFDGRMVKDIPVSMGKGGTVKGSDGQSINFWTNSGPHVVIGKTPTTRMTSASYGLTDPKDPNFYDEVVKLTVQISYSGEYVHLADWNIPDQGVTNTSHGCINVAPALAQWFYDNFNAGDVVDVRGTPVRLGETNGLGDWTVSWDRWLQGSAL
jgi:lipoprotein-anchoring transpeptidase ErfK/SrfK